MRPGSLSRATPNLLPARSPPAQPLSRSASTSNTAGCVLGPHGKYTVTMFAGDGIGPEIATAVQDIFAAAQVPISWEQHTISTHAVTPGGDLISQVGHAC